MESWTGNTYSGQGDMASLLKGLDPPACYFISLHGREHANSGGFIQSKRNDGALNYITPGFSLHYHYDYTERMALESNIGSAHSQELTS